MPLSSGNKCGDSFNFYLQKSIARWEPSFRYKYIPRANSGKITKTILFLIL